MERRTRLRVVSATEGMLRITKEAVERDTSASAAMSSRVTRDFWTLPIKKRKGLPTKFYFDLSSSTRMADDQSGLKDYFLKQRIRFCYPAQQQLCRDLS